MHFTVRVEIHQVTQETTLPATQCRCAGNCSHKQTKRETTEVLALTVRANSQPEAINKAIKMLEVNGGDSDD